jgi:hypothetical protein
VSDAPDPLGKRALYWAPAKRDEDGPRHADEGQVLGKHALYSGSDSWPASPVAAGAAPVSETAPAVRGRAGHPSHHRAPHDRAAARAVTERSSRGRPDELERPVGSGMFGSVTLLCSSCRVRTRVDLVEFVVLHVPLWFWRPGRGYTRFMSCPACRRRTWISASWSGWSR